MNRLKEAWSTFGDQLQHPPTKDDRILIIDSLNTFIRVFSAVPALNDNGQHVGGVVGFLKSVGANIRQFQATRCILVFDGSGGSQRRRKLYPEYKATRKNRDQFNRHQEFADLVDEKESMKKQFMRLAEYFDTLPVSVISIDHIEADDTIAYIANQYYKDVDNKITIVSTDRDFLQLVNDKIQVWSPTKKKLYTSERMRDEFGIHPDNYLLYRMMSGDASDNIPGIKGAGLKTLQKRIPKVIETPMHFDELIQEAQQYIDTGSKIKLYENIVSNRDILDRNYKLMQLQDTDIAASNKLNISSILDQPIDKLDIKTFKRLFLEDSLYVNIKNVDSWLRDTFARLNIFSKK